jgi:hypothetical protein
MDANEFWCRAFLAAMHGCYSSESSGSRHAARTLLWISLEPSKVLTLGPAPSETA